MACEVIIMSSNGEETILSFAVDSKADLQSGINTALQSKSQSELTAIKNILEADANLEDSVDLGHIANKISNNYEVIGEISPTLENYYTEGYMSQIQDKLNYLADNNVKLQIILTQAKNFKYGKMKSHGTVLPETTVKKLIKLKLNQVADPLARDKILELPHAIYVKLLVEILDIVADNLIYLYKPLENPFKLTKVPK